MNEKKIMLIRHGEKSSDDPVHLSARGMFRAQEYAKFFMKDEYRPDIIYAFKQKDKKSSNRAEETVLPLFKFLKTQPDSKAITLNNEYERDEVKKLVKDVLHFLDKEKNKKVLICWEHDVIIDILHELGHTDVKSYSVNCFDSKKNDDDDFSLMFIISYEENEKEKKGKVICSKTFQLGQQKGTSFEIL